MGYERPKLFSVGDGLVVALLLAIIVGVLTLSVSIAAVVLIVGCSLAGAAAALIPHLQHRRRAQRIH